MKGVMHIGDQRIEGGRVGDKATIGISDQLADFGFEVSRLKTGTPPPFKKEFYKLGEYRGTRWGRELYTF